MTLLNLNHFLIITQAELRLKGTFVKTSFMFVTIFLDIYENPRRNKFINPSCSKHPKIIKIKNDIIFIFALLCGANRSSPESFHFFESPKRSVRTTNLSFLPPISLG